MAVVKKFGDDQGSNLAALVAYYAFFSLFPLLLVLLGIMFIVATVASGLVTGGLGGPLAKVGGIVLSLLVNIALFGVAFRLMTSRTIATRCLWVGVLLAGAAWTILQVLGGIY